MPKTVPNEVRIKAVQEYRETGNSKEAAEKVGVHQGTLLRWNAALYGHPYANDTAEWAQKSRSPIEA